MELGENCVNLIPLGKVAWLIMNRRIILFDLSISKVLCKTNILKALQFLSWDAYFFCIVMSSFGSIKATVFNGSAFVYLVTVVLIALKQKF